MNKKEIIQELKQTSKELNHSVKKREISYNLYINCVRNFGSFNKAKKKANLEIKNERITQFPKRAFRIDKDTARIASFLTFDGHIYKDLSGFTFFSRNIEILKEMEKIIESKFNIKGKYYLNKGMGKKTHRFIIFNKKLATWLYKLGIPKGDKSIQKFAVPGWVSSSQELAREYLKIAFFCEGSNKEESGRTPRIQINAAKYENILGS